ncbi:MFS general substrate transporter [Aspergillus heteromorphus CBS 117.55]|uniref:MFS general substrate transporter n=1 Tax=Aspergillus heteromorphus CBS 117.55 TaxID=1448321 RepID=A0A317W660_9EURO|nr:MFS general substrate transporter [Aspergillus heteromorphus CBS 117.55]PWY80717.1 MFS general substrate transporter [Aspergillus heteromorphus CBS 117.55]
MDIKPPTNAFTTAKAPTFAQSRSIPESPRAGLHEIPPRNAFSIIEPPPDLSTLTVSNTTINQHLHSSSEETCPDGGLQSWIAIFGSFFLLMASYGLMNSLGVLQSYFATHQLSNYSASSVGWIPGIFIFMGLSLGVQVGPLFDRYGPTGITIVGTCCYVVGLALLAECTAYWHFVLAFGILAGSGAALLSTVAMGTVPHWFQRRVGLAMGIAMAGSGLGGVIFPWVLRLALPRFGYKWGTRFLALLVLTRLPRGVSKSGINLRCFRDSRFMWLTLGTFSLELEVFAGLGLYPTYVVMQGYSTNTSIILLSILNVFSCIGRLFAGATADKYGRLNTQTVLIAFAAVVVFVVWLPFGNTLVGLYLFSILFGLASGSFLSLAPVCIGQISKASEIGGRFGTCYSIVSIATLVSIPIGGEMLDAVGKQAMVAYLGGVLVLALCMFLMARWACLNYRWRWRAKI